MARVIKTPGVPEPVAEDQIPTEVLADIPAETKTEEPPTPDATSSVPEPVAVAIEQFDAVVAETVQQKERIARLERENAQLRASKAGTAEPFATATPKRTRSVLDPKLGWTTEEY